MCCSGCEAVAQAIINNGLADFYHKRTAYSPNVNLVPDELEHLDHYDNTSSENTVEHDLILEGISCSACIWLLEHRLRQLTGVVSFKVNYATRRAHIKSHPKQVQLQQIVEAVQSIGYNAYPYDPTKQYSQLQQERKTYLGRLGIAVFCGMQVMMITLGIYIAEIGEIKPFLLKFLIWASAFLTTPVVLYSAQPFFKSALRDIRNHSLGMDVPVALGIGLAFIASIYNSIRGAGDTYYESVCMFVIFLLFARYVEFLTRWYALSASESITQNTPTIAKKLNSQGGFTVVNAQSLQIGDEIQINPGAIIPADSIIKTGESCIDESILTGEKEPIKKNKGDKLLGGSHNLDNNLIAIVSCVSEDSTLSTISRLITQAQAEKPAWVTLADRYASWFVLFIIILTSSSAVYGWWVGDPNWFSIALSVLVVTCPCALSLATPTAYTATMSTLFSEGIIITNGRALETLGSTDHVVFDKTGTLTEGRMVVKTCRILSSAHNETFVFDIAASLEILSDHPIAQAFRSTEVSTPMKTSDVTHKPGLGICGKVDGVQYYLGSNKLIESILKQPVDDTEVSNTHVYLANENMLIAVFEIDDTIRTGVKSTLSWLKQHGKKVSLLSGDQKTAVDWFAKKVGINDYSAEASPAEKLLFIEQLQHHGNTVAMVGDGINDAPVLAKADVSIAVSTASQLARASSDILLLKHDMSSLKQVFILSKKTKHIILQNMSWALIYNLGALPLALLGHVQPWQAALGMSISSLIVVLNSFRIRFRSQSTV